MIFTIPVWRTVLGTLNTDIPVSLHSLYCDRNAGHDEVMIPYYLIATYNVVHQLVRTFLSLI